MKALFFTINKYPKGDAGAVRDEVICKMLIEMGYKVDIVCMGLSTDLSFVRKEKNVRHMSCRSNNNALWSRFTNYYRFFKVSKQLIGSNDYHLVIYDTLFPLATITVFRESWLKRIPVVHNSVEWYSSSEFLLSFFSPTYLLNKFTIILAARYATGVVAISRYLQDYFTSKNRIVLKVPFIVDVADYQVEHIEHKRKDYQVTFVYAGSPGRKDDIRSFLEAVALLNIDEKKRIKIDIVGVTREELTGLQRITAKTLSEVEGIANFVGRVTKDQAENYVKLAHFTFLFRDETKRFAKAGFPTKVVESCAMGVPVLCNLSSDLGEYLVDSENSIISESRKVEDIARSIRRCLIISESEWCRLSRSALELARTKFTYQYYLENLRIFLQEATKAIDTE